jgi:hypothetical protein
VLEGLYAKLRITCVRLLPVSHTENRKDMQRSEQCKTIGVWGGYPARKARFTPIARIASSIGYNATEISLGFLTKEGSKEDVHLLPGGQPPRPPVVQHTIDNLFFNSNL